LVRRIHNTIIFYMTHRLSANISISANEVQHGAKSYSAPIGAKSKCSVVGAAGSTLVLLHQVHLSHHQCFVQVSEKVILDYELAYFRGKWDTGL
jgi:hypothetical protein